MRTIHLITCEYPPVMGGVSEHSRVLAEAAVQMGYEVRVWTGQHGSLSTGIDVDAALGDFSSAALARADAQLDASPAPRRLIVQWVPHGYGRRGLNVGFSQWIRRRARAGDRIDLIVHEPFVDVFGASWRQPAMALVQRYMTWSLVRAADRVWLTIPGWEPRLRRARRKGQSAPQVLPVPGTIPPVHDPEAVAAVRATHLRGRSRLIGYFGAGGGYPLDAIRATAGELSSRRIDAAFVCIGRGSEAFAAAVQAGPVPGLPTSSTGSLPLDRVSIHLQACDLLLQPYADGVSGRRTTTVSALEHGIPVATTLGPLSEPFWRDTRAVEGVPVGEHSALTAAVVRLLDPARHAEARARARELYRDRFDPARTLKALLSDSDPSSITEPVAARSPVPPLVSHR